MDGLFSGIGKPHWWSVKDTTGTIIPAFAAMRITGSAVANGQTYLTVAKPNATTLSWLFNGPSDIAASKFGYGTFGPSFGLYDDAETPAVGETWGPANNSWELTKGKSGAVLLATGSGGRVLARQVDVSSVLIIEFTITAVGPPIEADVDVRPDGMATVPGETGGSVDLVNTDSYTIEVGMTGKAWYRASAWSILNITCPA